MNRPAMHKQFPGACVAGSLVALTLLAGCASTDGGSGQGTTASASAVPRNPVPAQAFSKYGRVSLKPVTLAAGAKGSAAALLKIDATLKKNLAFPLKQWNARPANGRTLVIQPLVEELSFQTASKAASDGPLAGSPGILIRVQIKDESGQLIANPEFFQRSSAVGAGFTMGVHDNLMIKRIADLTSEYILANFDKPVGGQSGAADKVLEAR